MEPIKLRVGTKWNGMIAIRGKYVDQAKVEGCDIWVRFPEGKMLIPNKELAYFHTRTEKKFKDNFSNELHDLVYYKVPKEGEIYCPRAVKKEVEEVTNTEPIIKQTALF